MWCDVEVINNRYSLPSILETLVASASTLVWDFDGVVADTEPVQKQAFTEILKRRGITPAPDYFKQFIGKSERDIWNVLAERFNISNSIDELIRERSSYYLQRAQRLRPAPFVKPMLDAARENGGTSIIVSSGSYRHIGALLEAWALRDRFASVLCSGSPDVESPSPKRELLQGVLARSSPPVLLIEDNEEYLTIGSRAGATTVAVGHSLNLIDASQKWDFVLMQPTDIG
ncbi:HAD family hydrolase [Nocardia sp. GCM10030253]|uniref:HAD family hydrolase n=1 Tax=Nocardia sp. GCM10030253 TaxID=3273404 RepID=UPI0036724364